MLRFLPICLIAVTGFVVRIAETADPSPAQVLEKAIYTEQTVGDLDTAVRLYESIAAKGKTNGDAAARAQFRIGLAHLKRGDRAAAAKAFQLLIEQHPNQKRLVAQARNLMPPVIDEAIERIRENYVDSLDDNDELMASALKGILNQLDPHSDFISAEKMKNFRVQLSGELVGIGVAISMKEDRLVVTRPIVGSPASRAGLHAGDQILTIDGKAMGELPKEKTLREAVRLLRGKAGTPVTVGILSPEAKEPKDVRIVRGKIKLESVAGDIRDKDGSWKHLVSKKPKIGYVRILSFRRGTAEEFGSLIAKLEDQGVQALVIDLRNNGGGLMQSTVAIADMILDEGVIVEVKGRKDAGKTLRATPQHLLHEVPIAILVNRMTASAAEILAGALRDHHRAVIVGERTFGKGSVQSLFPLRNGSAIKLTTARFYLPSGISLQKPPNAGDDDDWGVTPSEGFAVKLSEEEARAYAAYRSTRWSAASSKPPSPKSAASPTCSA